MKDQLNMIYWNTEGFKYSYFKKIKLFKGMVFAMSLQLDK